MTWSIDQFATGVAWIASAIGVGLWVWSWVREKDAVRRMRLRDCGLVLISSALLLRIVAQEKPMSVLDWAIAFLAPLFIAAALWRLARTACPPPGK
ncbi:hypothetical protein N0B44_17860 [Roseibacterium beibuensis]|uniref:hypothetical protein n=1 Tax=[Roseibacterium] beibuensis TaxID=1193142 RepID=UPI00217DC451|nr:hypothetical protein [Roseibacterium beibuensis]MCS6624785.1 hypothetical protein [Roseibacterium beibuensis]